MTRVFAVLGFALVCGTPPSQAQVSARTATPEEVRQVESGPKASEEQMASPMLLEVPLRSVSGIPAPAWMAKMKAPIWSSSESRKFVCDRARVERVMFKHGKPKKDFVAVTLTARIASEWFRQDIDVTLTLIDLDGKEVAKRIWDDETFGNDSGLTFGGHSKFLKLDAKVPRAEWDRWMAEEGSPTIKILLDVQGGESDD